MGSAASETWDPQELHTSLDSCCLARAVGTELRSLWYVWEVRNCDVERRQGATDLHLPVKR